MRKCCQRFVSINQKHYLDLGAVLVLVTKSSGKTVLTRLYGAVWGRSQLLAHKSHSAIRRRQTPTQSQEKYSELSCTREMLQISEKWSLTREFVKQYLTEKQNGYL